MTALDEYQRLEAPGLWRPAPDRQRRDVIVSVGDATLTLCDPHDRPLAHWSLPAVHRLNPGRRPARFAPSDAPDEGEELELNDEVMIAAIEKVRRAIERSRPHSGRLRLTLTLAVLMVAAALAVGWLPGAITRHTAAVLPEATRETVGLRLLQRVRQSTGAPCSGVVGERALGRLRARVLGGEGRLVVVPEGVPTTAHLPGGIILIGRALVEGQEDPDVVAGYILAERVRVLGEDPMLALLHHAGLWATSKLLTTGVLDDAVLDSYAKVLLTAPPAPVSDPALLGEFSHADISSTPYAMAVDPTGETTLGLIEADPVSPGTGRLVLSDDDWVSLQGICLD